MSIEARQVVTLLGSFDGVLLFLPITVLNPPTDRPIG